MKNKNLIKRIISCVLCITLAVPSFSSIIACADVSEYMTSGQRANFEAEEEAIKQESFSAFSIKNYLNTNKGEIYSVTGDDIKKQELHDMPCD